MFTTFEELKQMKLRGFSLCFGCFDLFHVGHLNFLNEIKKISNNKLVVGVLSDFLVKRLKGEQRPIISQSERLNVVSSIKGVDFAFLVDCVAECESLKEKYDISEEERPLWELLYCMQQLKPDIIFGASDFKITNKMHKFLEEENLVFATVDYTSGISTTMIINRIKSHT